MVTIALRAYNHGIEQILDQGQIETAIAHCRHILSLYPSHLKTNQQLARAYLEGGNYRQAAALYQGVLNVLPDDFSAHLALSRIAEEQGYLDNAVRHMERAFETQPSSTEIQDELRRLNRLRSNEHDPGVIRLNSGALVRMYCQHQLYPLAINEIRSTLAENPERLDLLTLLADCYYQEGNEEQAEIVCLTILKTCPHSREANRIMARLLTDRGAPEQAQIHHQRLQNLDPYHAFTNESVPREDLVPDWAVMLERLTFPENLLADSLDQEAEHSETENSITTPVLLEIPADLPVHLPEARHDNVQPVVLSMSEEAKIGAIEAVPEPAHILAASVIPGWLVESPQRTYPPVAENLHMQTGSVTLMEEATMETPAILEEVLPPEPVQEEDLASFLPADTHIELQEVQMNDFGMNSGNGHDPVLAAVAVLEAVEHSSDGFIPEVAEPVEVVAEVGQTQAPEIEAPLEAGESELEQARLSLARGNVRDALDLYGALIAQQRLLPEVIQDLQTALDTTWIQLLLWKHLADAFEGAEQYKEASRAYRQVLEQVWPNT